MSMIAPTPFPVLSSPSSPTTPRPPTLPSGADTNRPAIILEAGAGSGSFKGPSPVVPLMSQGAEPSTVPSTQPVPVSDHSLLSYMTTSASQPAALRAHVSILDATTRLQHFRAMIAEMRATLLRYDLEVEEEDQGFRTGNGDNDDDGDDDHERERVLRLLEDVTRKAKHLTDKDAAGLGRCRPVTITEIEYDNSLGLLPTPTVSCFAGEKRQVFPSYYPLITERPRLVNRELCL